MTFTALAPGKKIRALYACDPFLPRDELNPGGDLISPENVNLLVLMVCEVPEESLAWFRKHLMPPHQLRRQVAARELELQERMLAVTQKLESMGYAVESRVERGQQTGQVITDVAALENVDLIILERRPQKPWQRILLGSVADYVTRRAPQPLLIMPPVTRATEQDNG